MYLIFDTETTGLPINKQAPLTDFDNWPRIVQIAWQLHDEYGKLINHENIIVKPDGFTIPYNSEKVHGISTELAIQEGIPLQEALQRFSSDLERTKYIVGHNIVEFDVNIIGSEYLRAGLNNDIEGKEPIDTQLTTIDFCALPGGRGGSFKWPTLLELHEKLFGEGFGDAHDAAYDVAANTRCFFGLIEHEVVKPEEGIDKSEITYEEPELSIANFRKKATETTSTTQTTSYEHRGGDHAVLPPASPFTILRTTGYSRYQGYYQQSQRIQYACRGTYRSG